ncbi:MAG: hypothetical protein ACK5JS_06275 [Mangrovibacterium sp.]
MKILEAAKIYHNTNRADFNSRLNRRFKEMANTLDEIATKDLSPEQLEDIELILDATVRKNYPNKKVARKALNSIHKLFYKHFQFVSRNHYRTIYIALFLGFSLLIGTLFISKHPFLFVPIMCLGLILGIVFGNKYDKLADKENRVIDCW